MVTPSASTSRLVRKVSSAVSAMRSPRAGRIAKGTSPRVGGAVANKVLYSFFLYFSSWTPNCRMIPPSKLSVGVVMEYEKM